MLTIICIMSPCDTSIFGTQASSYSEELTIVSTSSSTELFRLDGQIALVTGASSGIGEHCARTLHRAGARVALLARRLHRLEALSAELQGTIAVRCDLADPVQRERSVREVEKRLGRIDVLVNNAGLAFMAPIEEESLTDFERVVEVNLAAVWHLSKLVGAGMVDRRRGSIVNVGSMLGLVASSPLHQAGYAASKGGVVNLTRELAVQWGGTGVRVNNLAPGYIRTDMTAEMEDERSQRFVARGTALGRMGSVGELEGPLLLLASDAGSYMTGTTLVVDGGWTSR
jgi:NAD(P)-dependent dehydrogenase (short-subunit alcohol dehydrogenase family)